MSTNQAKVSIGLYQKLKKFEFRHLHLFILGIMPHEDGPMYYPTVR